MKISELTKAPQWLIDAETQYADVEIIDGRVIWKSGTWKSGTWKSGTWERGIWESGIWEGGIWEGGIWESGTWERGIWKSGIWKSGIWKSGIWEGGIWEGGRSSIIRCKWVIQTNGDRVSIGCKEKTIKEWDEWFASDEVFETDRDTEQFAKIRHAYEVAKFSILNDPDNKPNEPRN